jgi:hypothetical protein
MRAVEVMKMSKAANIVTIEHLEVKKSDIEKVKRIFKVKDNVLPARRG